MRFTALLILLITVSVLWMSAQGSDRYGSLDATKDEIAFIDELQQAVKSENIAWIAQHVLYPIRVQINGKIEKVTTPTIFTKYYKEIFNDNLRISVLQQDTSKLRKTPQGVMLGNGAVWVKSLIIGSDPNAPATVYLIAINN